MNKSHPCAECGNNIPPSAERCPHCARPGLFPNVRAAEDSDERAALDKRYQSAITEAAKRSTADEGSLRDFEAAMANSRAVIARSAKDVLKLATNDNEIYATYYQQIDGGLKLPAGDKWDVLRGLADKALFPGYEKEIRFAALSLDGIGLSNYGECSIILRDELIAHRASVFEENSTVFMKTHDIKLWDAVELPQGYRATWNERGKLCVAKLSGKIDAATKYGQYSGLLLRQGATSEEDEFVEVHIWGPMTVRTIERVIFIPAKRSGRDVILKTLKDKLKKADVKVS
ncbi:MAG: hypothetical protein ABR577_01865 [Pyrinomonadaceae bacterium]